MRAKLAVVVIAVMTLVGCTNSSPNNPEPGEADAAGGDGANVMDNPTPEGEMPGDKSWRRARGRADDPNAMSGYASKPSSLPGEPVSLHVSTTADTYRVIA